VFIFVFEEANLWVRVCDEFLWKLGVEVWPRQASVLACVLAGTREGLVTPRVLGDLVVGVEAPSDLAGSILVEILLSVEGGDVEQGCSNLEIFLPCLRLLSLTCVYISCMHTLFISLYV